MTRRRDFPADFLWGVATADYQIEGSLAADGRGESAWDRFCARPGAIRDGADARTACDSYRRWPDDLALLRELGVTCYRFSIGWSRVLPDGERPNPAGLAHYGRMVDDLLAHGIRPLVTLWHADHPQALEERGGWLWPGMVDAFARYADACYAALGDRVRDWITLNEPNCFLYQGYGTGTCAPGKEDWTLAFQAIHHALLAHGEAVRRCRARGAGRVGITMSVDDWVPASDRAEDAAAAAWAADRNTWWLLDPVLGGRYPEAHRAALGALAPPVAPGDLARMHEPGDFLGINYYNRHRVSAGERPQTLAAKDGPATSRSEICPDGLRAVMAAIDARHGRRAYVVTENGLYAEEPPPVDGIGEDPARVAFLAGHIAALADARRAGIDVRGYCHWSLMDNFEWSAGYRARLGLYWTDLATQRRIPKRSARWYRDFLRDEG